MFLFYGISGNQVLESTIPFALCFFGNQVLEPTIRIHLGLLFLLALAVFYHVFYECILSISI